MRNTPDILEDKVILEETLQDLNLSSYYLGKKLPLYKATQCVEKTEFVLKDNKLILFLDEKSNASFSNEMLNTALQSFLFKQSKRYIEKRILHFQSHFKTKPRKITIEKSYKKWGTCNSQRELTFNYVLITKLPEAIDYVVVHELCHLTHLNHDRSFWRLLGSILPKYKDTEKLLGA